MQTLSKANIKAETTREVIATIKQTVLEAVREQRLGTTLRDANSNNTQTAAATPQS
ncbi:MAG TPA: hypothetical protein VGT41_03050 [Candidatus Babeliales bacterium]|nr:hypothetical protein [Candidatus Babeliales bacterium]